MLGVCGMPGRLTVTDEIYEIGVGETLTVENDLIGVWLQDYYVNDGHHPADDPGPIFINRGAVNVTSNREEDPSMNWVFGIDHDSPSGSFFMNAAFVNAAGAVFSVSHSSNTGQAFGFYCEQWSADFTNHGLFRVTSAHIAVGIENWNGNSIDRRASSNFFFDNTGEIRVSGANEAYGALFYNGAYATNTGLIEATASKLAWGVLMFGHAPELINAGAIVATQTAGINASVGVYVAGGVFGSHLVNTGTITADVAIRENDFDPMFGLGRDLIENSGSIFGDIQLSFGEDEIRNTGAIHGKVSFGDGDDLFLGSGGQVFGALSMGGGDDRVEAGLRDDEVRGGDGRDQLDGGAGADDLFGEGGDDLLFGGLGDDHLRGGAGHDVLFGGDGDDVLEAQGGDGLSGGAGSDRLMLGAGADLVILGLGAGSDEVIGFDTAADRFGLTGMVFQSAVVEGADTRLTYAGGTVLIRGVAGLTLAQWNGLIDPTGSIVGEAGVSRIGGGGDDDLSGSAGADFLYGGAGYDILRGLEGDDRLIDREGDGAFHGGAGDDVLIGGDGHLFMDGGDGQDVLEAGGGDDQLLGGAGADTLHGGAGDDVITGGAGANLLFGGEGDDLIAGGDDGERIYGNAGRDIIHAGGGNDRIDDGGDGDLIYGEGGDDEIHMYGDGQAHGGDGADWLVAEGDRASLYGEGDNDVLSGRWTTGARLYGGDGDDRITTSMFEGYAFGGAGDDFLAASDYDAVLQGGAGNDDLHGTRAYLVTADYSDALDYVTVDLRISGRQNTHAAGLDSLNSIGNLNGSAYADILTGSGAANVLSGGLGGDRLDGDGGSDWLVGGGGGDILNGGDGGDVLLGEAGDDVLDGGAGLDVAVFSGDRALYTITVAGAVTTVTGPEGTERLTNVERLHFADGPYSAIGGAAAGALVGTGNADLLSGGSGDDVIFGGAGDDVIRPNGGLDSVHGGEGIDTVVLPYTVAEYRITDFGGVTAVVFGNQTLICTGVERLQFDTRTILLAPNGGDYIVGGAADDFLIGLERNDEIHGGTGADRLEGRAGADRLDGGSGDDTLNGGAGDDTILGGLGWDTLVLQGTKDDYVVLRSGEDFIVKGLDGSDRLSGVEILRFSDGSVIDLARQFELPPGEPSVEDPFVLPPLPDDQPLILPGAEADKFGDDALVLPGVEDFAPRLFLGLEARLDMSGGVMLTLDDMGRVIDGPAPRDGWLF